jgi:hypothetical protein
MGASEHIPACRHKAGPGFYESRHWLDGVVAWGTTLPHSEGLEVRLPQAGLGVPLDVPA